MVGYAICRFIHDEIRAQVMLVCNVTTSNFQRDLGMVEFEVQLKVDELWDDKNHFRRI